MNESSLNATEIAVGSLLAGGRGGYGGGGGAWGGYGGHAPFAGPASNAVRINAGNRATAAGIENLLDQNQFSATNKNVVDGDARICDKLSDNANRSSDNAFRAELRGSDQLAALTAEIAANARIADKCCCDTQKAIAEAAKEAAKCCCDAKLQACKDHAELTALVIKENSQTREMINGNALDAANARITQLETIDALRHHGHHGS